MENKSKLESLLSQAESTMAEDIRRIEHFGKTKKLTPGYARDIREYVKILTLILSVQEKAEAKKKNDLASLTDDELREKAREFIGE